MKHSASLSTKQQVLRKPPSELFVFLIVWLFVEGSLDMVVLEGLSILSKGVKGWSFWEGEEYVRPGQRFLPRTSS